MRHVFLLVLFLYSFAQAGERPLEQRVAQVQELESEVSKKCINNSKSESVKIDVGGKSYSCPQLLIITKRLHENIDKEVSALESCSSTPLNGEGNNFATQVLQAAQKAGTCEAKSQEFQCLAEFSCSVFAATPFVAMAGNKLSAEQASCKSKGVSNAQNCISTLMKGVFDSLFGMLSDIWTLGKGAVVSAAEWAGIVKKNEASSSDKLLAAQQAGPGFLKRLTDNPVQTLKDMSSAIYSGIRDAAYESYGCEKWSGAPFVSSCLRPMSNWDCASCQQKLQVICGVAGYGVGAIPVAFLTGGLTAAAKAIAVGTLNAVKASALANKISTATIAVVNKIPKSAEGLEALSRSSLALARGAGRVLTATEQEALKAWKLIEDSSVSQAVMAAASKVSGSVVGDAARVALLPVNLYLDAIETATKMGMKTVDRALAARTPSGALAVEASSVSNKENHYQRMSALDNDERILEAEKVLNRPAPLPQHQRDAVLEAHEVGRAEGRGFGTYTEEDKFRKGRILMKAGFSRDEAQKLLDEGIAGAVATTKSAAEVEKLSINSLFLANRSANSLGSMRSTVYPVFRAKIDEVLGDFESAGRGFLDLARRAEGKPVDFVKAADAFARAGKVDEAEKILKEVLRKSGDKGMIRAELEARIKEVSKLREVTPKNVLYGTQEQNLKNLLGRLEDSNDVPSFTLRPDPKRSDKKHQGELLNVSADKDVEALGNITNSGLFNSRRASAHESYNLAGDTLAGVAQRSKNQDDYVEAITAYAKGLNPQARSLAEDAIKNGVDRESLKTALQAKLKVIEDLKTYRGRNPEYGVQEASLKELIAKLDKPAEVPLVVESARPVETVSVSARTQPLSPPAAKPEIRATNSVTPERPVASPVREPSSLKPQDIANDYRLGRNGKPVDPTKASHFYYRAADDALTQEMTKKRKYGENSRYFDDQNISSAFNESLKGDGEVALKMIDRLATNERAINEFLWEMQELGAYQQVTPTARANMHKVIDKLQKEHKDLLYTPQTSSVRSWRNYNSLSE